MDSRDTAKYIYRRPVAYLGDLRTRGRAKASERAFSLAPSLSLSPSLSLAPRATLIERAVKNGTSR